MNNWTVWVGLVSLCACDDTAGRRSDGSSEINSSVGSLEGLAGARPQEPKASEVGYVVWPDGRRSSAEVLISVTVGQAEPWTHFQLTVIGEASGVTGALDDVKDISTFMQPGAGTFSVKARGGGIRQYGDGNSVANSSFSVIETTSFGHGLFRLRFQEVSDSFGQHTGNPLAMNDSAARIIEYIGQLEVTCRVATATEVDPTTFILNDDPQWESVGCRTFSVGKSLP